MPDVGFAIIDASVALPDPVKVRVGVVKEVVPIVPALLNVKAPLPDASIEPPLVPTVNNRSVLAALPVYFRVPPLITKLEAEFVDLPILLFDPPAANVDTDNVPALIVVTPVYVLVPDRVSVPVPVLVKPTVVAVPF